MFDAYLIEVDNEAAGILVRDGRGYRFHAVVPSFGALEHQEFASPWKAERAAVEFARLQRRSGRLQRLPEAQAAFTADLPVLHACGRGRS